MIDAEIDRMTLREPLRIYTEQTSDLGGIWAFKPYAMTHVEFVEVSDYEAQRDLVDVQAAEITRLRAQVEAADRLAEAGREAVEVVHKSYVAATMEAVNAGGAHPLTKNYDAWRVRCMNAETAMRAALAAYQPQREETP